MLDIIDLERRWKKYRIKKSVPIYISVLIGISLASAGTYFIVSTSVNLNKVPELAPEIVTESESIKIEEKTLTPITQVPIQEKKAVTILTPSFSFSRNIPSHSNVPIYLPPKPSTSISSKAHIINSIASSSSSESPIITEPVTVKEVVHNELKILKHDNELDLQDVINRFKKNKNPKLSLHIAKKYYELGKYNKSYNYALITNQIDESIEDSWIIFAKSLYKLGEKKMAQKTLSSYIKSSESIKASLLLGEMQKGSFQ